MQQLGTARHRHPSHLPPTIGRRPVAMGAAALVATTLAVLASASNARAAMTGSSVSAPADGTLLLENQATEPIAPSVAVEGTTTGGEVGEKIDVDCYRGGARIAIYAGAGEGEPLEAGGRFKVAVPEARFGGLSCVLLAVPHGTHPEPPTGYSGPRVAFSQFRVEKRGAGINSGDVTNERLEDATFAAEQSVESIDSCGAAALLLDGSAQLGGGPGLFNCGGSLYNSRNAFEGATPDLARAELEVDGQNAYGSSSAQMLFEKGAEPGSSELNGFPVLIGSLVSFSAATGDALVEESEPIVRCSPGDSYTPSYAACSSFVPTGVALARTARVVDGGRVAIVTDTYSSADGAAHALSLQYETDLAGGNASWELPGEILFRKRGTGEAGGPPAAAPGSVLVVHDPGEAPSVSNPIGAITYATPYASVRFDNTLFPGHESALFEDQATVPAGGSTSITWGYSTASSLAEVEAQTDEAVPPTIAIASPANGTGVGSPITVTGTAGAGSGVKSVTVNGVVASVSGSGFSAPLLLTPGNDTITATVTSNAGHSQTTAVTVSYVPPVALTGGASHLSDRQATLAGTITPGSTPVSYYAQYGSSTGYGRQTPAGTLPAGAVAGPVSVIASGLAPHATYHYRLVASGAGGISYGTDRTFTTLWALRGLSMRARALRGRHRVRGYRVSGKLRFPKGLSVARACRGRVTLVETRAATRRAKARVLARRTVRVRAVKRRKRVRGCGYASRIALPAHGLGRHAHVAIEARFDGNRLVAPFSGHPVSVRVR